MLELCGEFKLRLAGRKSFKLSGRLTAQKTELFGPDVAEVVRPNYEFSHGKETSAG
jgi:hypothetical protein